jgi:hypothetical protein
VVPVPSHRYTEGMNTSHDALRLRLTLALSLAAAHEIDALVRMMRLREASRLVITRRPTSGYIESRVSPCSGAVTPGGFRVKAGIATDRQGSRCDHG